MLTQRMLCLLLHMPLQSIRARASWLVDTGVLADDAIPADLGDFVRAVPDFFSMNPKSMDSTIDWLSSFGLSQEQAKKVLLREPGVLAEPLAQLELRASFFTGVVGGTIAELVEVHVCDIPT